MTKGIIVIKIGFTPFLVALVILGLTLDLSFAQDDASSSEGILPLEDFSGDISSRSRMTGDWNDARTEWAEKGITLEIDWAQYFMGVVDGGRDEKFEYGGSLDYKLNLDLHRMGVLPGGLITFRAETLYGESLRDESGVVSPVNTDLLFPLTDNADDNVTTITTLSYTQFLSDTFGLILGKLDTLDGDANEFAGHRGSRQFMNLSFVANPVTGVTAPYSTLAAGFLWLPNDQVLLTASIYDSEDSSTTSGFDTVFEDGTGVAGELYLQHKLADKPGGQMFGFSYGFDGEFVVLDARQIRALLPRFTLDRESESWSVYWNLWQYIQIADDYEKIDVFDGKTEQGWGVFLRGGLADEDTNPVESFVSGGIGGRGIVPGRDHDSFGIGYYYATTPDGRLATLLGFEDSGQGAEFYYDFAFTPWMHLTANVQIIDPAFKGDDTYVVGGRLVTSF